jgi:hypothetical protein
MSALAGRVRAAMIDPRAIGAVAAVVMRGLGQRQRVSSYPARGDPLGRDRSDPRGRPSVTRRN